MPTLFDASQVITQQQKRVFIQLGGPRPNNATKYGGQDAQYMQITAAKIPELGGIDPIWAPDPRRAGQYKIIGRTVKPPDLPTADLTLYERRGVIPFQLAKIGCQFSFYEVSGQCNDLSNFLSGWTDYVMIYSNALVMDKDLGSRTAFADDKAVEDKLSLKLADIYPVGALGFGETAAAQVNREVTDIVYGSTGQCGDCGPADDGTQRIYAVTKSSGAGSPGLPGQLEYSLDGGITWTPNDITGIGSASDPTALDLVGSNLVVVVPADTAYYYTPLDTLGRPTTWTKVTSGFVAGAAPQDLFVLTSREVFFAGGSGYLYKATDVTAGVTVLNAGAATTSNLQRIHGQDETLVATGANSTVVVSFNRGQTWARTSADPSAVATNVQAVAVLDANRYWVGLGLGRVMYTLNGGLTWNEKAFSGAGAGQVYDIVFPTDDVGYFAFATNTPSARLYATINGGADWTNTAPRVLNLPTHNRTNRIATPRGSSDPATAANNVALGGLSGGGTDGVIYIGAATRL